VVIAHTPDEARAAFVTLGRQPVAFKVVSRDIIHKSDAGGVRLNVADDFAQRTSARCSMTSVRRTS